MSEAVYRALSGRSSGPDKELSGMSVADLARAVRAGAGTQRAAAAALGVSTTTFRRWESGGVKTPKGLEGLRQAARSAVRRSRMGPRKLAKLRGGTPAVTVKGEVTVSADTRNRAVQLGGAMPAGTLAPVVDAYLAGDDQAAADAMHNAIGTAVRGMSVGDVDSLRIGGR